MIVGICFPHQLFEENVVVSKCDNIYLVEEFLFFRQYTFHKQKIIFHRASLKFYESYLSSLSKNVVYIDSFHELADIRKLIPHLKSIGIDTFEYMDTTDCWLEQRIQNACKSHQVTANKNQTKLFLNSSEEIFKFFSNKKRMFQTEFYKDQRQRRSILLEKGSTKPLSGKWTFDDENRLKYPKGKIPPQVDFVEPNVFYAEAVSYTQKYFSENYGKLNSDFIYPTTFSESKEWLQFFFKTRFSEFGAFEDAIVLEQNILHHSVLSPMMNVGLLTPKYVIEEALIYATKHDIPINSLEGFIRQILGWREFIRAVYQLKGSEERTKNYWGFSRKIPPSFWNGTTGIEPIDFTIKKVLETGYCHHIERLMLLGNFMLLCEFDPSEVYRWFMELFIDAYDWVMVPNVYGMSQFADGGLMATKPYISGSNYLMKMSDYKKGEWQKIWDGLFWRFLNVQRDYFLANPRLGMLVRMFDKMPAEKRSSHLSHATKFLDSLSF
jgi:deoxyribodipyrimidine photolyase-related protein